MNRWQSPNPAEVVRLMRRSTAEWWICGGWAIELFVGRSFREHSDLEIGCFRTNVPTVLSSLAGWDIRISRNKVLTPYTTDASADESFHALWCRPQGSAKWVLEILIESCEGDDWVYRRDVRIRRPAGGLRLLTESGIPYLRPEVQLLYKAKQSREKDDQDFWTAWPLLDRDAKTWLANAIRDAEASCQWHMAGATGI